MNLPKRPCWREHNDAAEHDDAAVTSIVLRTPWVQVSDVQEVFFDEGPAWSGVIEIRTRHSHAHRCFAAQVNGIAGYWPVVNHIRVFVPQPLTEATRASTMRFLLEPRYAALTFGGKQKHWVFVALHCEARTQTIAPLVDIPEPRLTLG